MKFRIIGAERETGAYAETIVDAPTPSAAEERANAIGILLERMEPVIEPLESERLPSRSVSNRIDDVPPMTLPNVSAEANRGQLHVRTSVWRLVAAPLWLYIRCWRSRTGVTALSHVCVVLAAAWAATVLVSDHTKGAFPPLAEFGHALNRHGYFRLDREANPDIIRGRAASRVDFGLNANQPVGIIHVYTDLNDPARVIAFTSAFRTTGLGQSLIPPDELDEQAITAMFHRIRTPEVVEEFCGAKLWAISLARTKAGDYLPDRWMGQCAQNGYIVQLLRWGDAPPDPMEGDDRMVIALDSSFAF